MTIMNSRFLPTDSEKAGIAEIVAWRTRILFMVFIPMAIAALCLFLEDFLQDKVWLFAGLVTAVFVSLMGTVVYVSFFLRCPRCSTWTGMGVNKCASCGLRYDAQESRT